MRGETMAVRSRLKIVLSDYNHRRVLAGQNPVTIRTLADEMDLSPSVITGLTTGRAKQVALETLNKICRKLECQPGDILVYVPDEAMQD